MRIFESLNHTLRRATAGSIIVLLMGALPFGAWAAPNPDEGEDDVYVAVLAGRIIPIVGEEIEGGVIVLKNGKIEAVGKNVDYPRGTEVIHAEDLTVMPGLVNPCTSLGIRRFNRSGVHGDLKAADEFTLDPKVHGELLSCGFTTLGLLPQGSGIPGQAYAFKPEGAGRAEWTLNETAYLLVDHTNPSRDKTTLKKALETAKKEIEKVEKARKDWEEKQKKKAEEEAKKKAEQEKKQGEEKKNEGEGGGRRPSGSGDEPEKKPQEKGEEKKEEDSVFKPPPINPVYQPLVDMIQKKEGAKAVVALGGASDFLHYKEAVEGYADLAWTYLLDAGSGFRFGSSGNDLHLVLEDFGKEKAKVILRSAITVMPLTTNRINLPALFARAGCEVSLLPSSDSVPGHARFLDEVAHLIKGNMDRKDALAAITLHPARVLGLQDRIGSLEKGKDGNLLFLTKDPFDALARVEKVMIQGKVAAEGRAIQ